MASAKVLAAFEPVTVHFDTIKVSQQAVIIRGDDGGVLNQIRAELVEALPLPVETKRPPDTVHSSIACYTQPVPVESI